MRAIDDRLKIMVAATMMTLSRQNDKSWDAIVRTMMQNEIAIPDGEGIARSDTLVRNNLNDFKFDGGPDASIVKEVRFTILIFYSLLFISLSFAYILCITFNDRV